jgi:hypothetical protein
MAGGRTTRCEGRMLQRAEVTVGRELTDRGTSSGISAPAERSPLPQNAAGPSAQEAKAGWLVTTGNIDRRCVPARPGYHTTDPGLGRLL